MQQKEKAKLPTYKIVMLGATSVGKTSMVSQFVTNNFDTLTEETADDFREYIKLVNLNKGDQQAPQYCVLKIVDLFGIDHPDLSGDDKKKQELLKRYTKNEFVEKETKQLHPLYRDKKVYGYMFVYDVTDYESLNKLIEYIDFIVDVEKKLGTGVLNVTTKKILVGNKMDMPKKDQEQFAKTIREIAMKTKMQIMECSAFENIHIDQCFEELARSIYTEVAFEAYEQELANTALQQEQEANPAQDAEENKPKKKAVKKKGFLGCGGTRRDEVDEDDEDEQAREKGEELVETKDLPVIGIQKNGCWLF